MYEKYITASPVFLCPCVLFKGKNENTCLCKPIMGKIRHINV